MIKMTSPDKRNDDMVKPMCEMKPLEVGQMLTDGCYYVMRTASEEKFEVMNISKASPLNCWTHKEVPLEVRILPPGESVKLEVSNPGTLTGRQFNSNGVTKVQNPYAVLKY